MNFCLYHSEQEENRFIQKQAKTWQRSGLLSEEQFKIIEERTAGQLVETSLFFRILFFVFTWICLGATIGLVGWILDLNDEGPFGFLFLFFSILTYVLSEYLVRRYHFYRHGIEEALALLSLALFCGGVMLLILSLPGHPDDHQMILIAATLVALFSFWLYRRFGFVYASLIGIVALCIVPFQLSLPPVWARTLLFLMLWLLFLMSLKNESTAPVDFRKERKGVIQACLFAGIYLTVNLRLSVVSESWFTQIPPYLNPYAGVPPAVYWPTYVLIFFLPAVGLYLGIRDRKRALMNMAGITLILSLATNKDYLGLQHYTWDPMIFGAMLILAAILRTGNVTALRRTVS
jgi:hypothetical protein